MSCHVLCARLTRHRVRLNTLKLLLERGADPNVSRVPMPVLFLAIMAADTEAVRRLLLCGARTDIPLPYEVGNTVCAEPQMSDVSNSNKNKQKSINTENTK